MSPQFRKKAAELWCLVSRKTRKARKSKSRPSHLGKRISNSCFSHYRTLTLLHRDPKGNELPKSLMNRVILFQKKQKKDTIDVWWLSDDGGT
jgi:hypothetical protein